MTKVGGWGRVMHFYQIVVTAQAVRLLTSKLSNLGK